ncbi:MAG TPA: MlaD family protein [Nevskiaceae bacterium]|nr:MlaD family protein [Nevskiaceae bacterium]
MTAFKVNLTVVGMFVVAALATLIVSLALLAGRTGPTDTYYTEFGNVAGLKYGTQVLFEGYPIGQVQSIDPSQDPMGKARFRISLSVTRGWHIPNDSVARSVAPGLLAAQTIAISAGKSATMLEPGATIPGGMSTSLQDSFSSIAGNVDTLTDQSLMPLVDNLNKQVTRLGVIIDTELDPLVGNANRFMKTTADHWPLVMKNVENVSADLAVTSKQLDTLLDDQRIAAIDRLIANLDKSAANMQQASGSLQELMSQSGPDLKASLREFRFTSEALSRHAESFSSNIDSAALNLQEFSRRIRENPGLLLRSPEAKEDPAPPYRRKE